MYKNIIHITGNDSYGVELELERWLGAFRGKFGDINIDRYDLGDKESMRGVGDMILMSGLFAEKRLFIFRGGRDRRSKTEGLERILSDKIADIPEDHYLLFHNIGEKEAGLTSWIVKNADTRKIDTIWDIDTWGKRSNIDIATLKLILSTYRSAESARAKDEPMHPLIGHDIAHTIEMVILTQSRGVQLSTAEIVELCHGYGGDTMFALADAVMTMEITRALDILHRLAMTTRVDEWIASLIGTLRNHLYAKYLQSLGQRESETSQILQRAVYQSYKSPISYTQLSKFYTKLVTMSVAYKRGKGLGDSELGRILAIELALLDLQKSKNT